MNAPYRENPPIPDPDTYVSCQYIEGTLVFALGDLCLCCITNHGKGYPKVGHYEGGELPLKRILARRRQVRTQNQKEERYARCAGCGYLERRRWEQEPYPFRHLILAHFTRCNLKCRYCYTLRHGYLDKPYASYDLMPALRSMTEKNLLSPQGQVTWGGGEPLLYEGFDTTFRMLLDYGVMQDVNTNGTVLSPTLLEALRRRRVILTCSVDAGTAATFALIKGRDFFGLVWKNLEAYAATGGEVAAKMIVTLDNHHEVIPFIERARAAGITRILYDVDFFDLRQPDEIVQAIALLIKEATEDRNVSVCEGGGGIASFGEALRARIDRSLDQAVTWKEFVEKRERIRELGDRIRSLEEKVQDLEASRALRSARWLREKHPLLTRAVLKSLDLWNRTR